MQRLGQEPVESAAFATPESGVAVDLSTLTRPFSPTRGLRQPFENPLRNAVKHGLTSSRTESGDAAEHGGPNMAVVGDLPGGTGFCFADDGPGIPESDRERGFESGHSTSGSGTRFGLSIVDRIAEAHGWTVRVTESETGGARFEIDGVERAERPLDEPSS